MPVCKTYMLVKTDFKQSHINEFRKHMEREIVEGNILEFEMNKA